MHPDLSLVACLISNAITVATCLALGAIIARRLRAQSRQTILLKTGTGWWHIPVPNGPDGLEVATEAARAIQRGDLVIRFRSGDAPRFQPAVR